MNIPDFIDSRFRFTIMVAKRAKQLINGAPKLIELESENPVTTAIEEVSLGKVSFDIINSAGVDFGEEEVSDEQLEEEGDLNSEESDETNLLTEVDKSKSDQQQEEETSTEEIPPETES